jgi:tetratricopeptide (TPR) repeat protein
MPPLQVGNSMKSHNFNTYFLRPNLLNEDTLIELEELTKKYPWFQLAWILYAKNLKQLQSSDYEKVVKQVSIRVSDRKRLFNYLNSKVILKSVNFDSANSFLPTYEIDSEELKSSSLIDRFLSSNSGTLRRNSEEKISGENVTHNDVVERSTAEDDELITETLANIYLQQKKYTKAIYAFEKLSLKYPEKSIYFATRIKEAEDLKNTN